MRLALRRHPDSPSVPVTAIDVHIAPTRPDNLVLSYTVTGNLNDIRMSPVATPARSDALWRTTCFEAFLRASSGPGYYEFNFAPSTQWAAYHFSGYRSGMRAADFGAPAIDARVEGDRYTLRASLDLRGLSLPREEQWLLGLSAVIEDVSGGISYWALAHPPGKPDFHDAACFAHAFYPAALQ
jgi:hypothetical protein